MSHQSDLIATDIDAYLEQHRTKELLRLLTCGSVDDGKSTLIGRLLHDSKLVYEDQLAAVKDASIKHGTTGETVDLALLVDGLKAEREQGITIDVAYRYFSTAKRKFIIADCPGHEQYTRNMATGASTCDLAIILVDARKGLLPQTKRHSFIVSLLGIKHMIVAVNKMDLVDYNQGAYDEITSAYREFASRLDLHDVRFLPLSALKGDNVVDASVHMPWYQGATLMHLLESIHIASDRNLIDLRLPVQMVMRPNSEFRGFAGTLASGVVRTGDSVLAMPSGESSCIDSIIVGGKKVQEAAAPTAVAVTLQDEIDISRGDMLVAPTNRARSNTSFDAMMVWMHERPLVPGKEYLIKHTTRVVAATVTTLRYAVDVNTVHRIEQPTLELNQIGRVAITTHRPLFHDPYRHNRTTGAFIVIDRIENTTVGAGMIIDRTVGAESHWDKPAGTTLSASKSPVSQQERNARFGQKPAVVFLTGLTGSGKTTIARILERKLFELGRASTVLDGQDLRRGISCDLGFGTAHRSENVRRFAEVSRLFNSAGLIVIGALVAPHRAVRDKAVNAMGREHTFVVHVQCPIEICRQRDTNDMYAKADRGEIGAFPGVSAPYEPPLEPSLVVTTDEHSADECADQILKMLIDNTIF